MNLNNNLSITGIGGSDEQQEFMQYMADKGFDGALVHFCEEHGQCVRHYAPRSSDESLLELSAAVDVGKELADPVEFEKAFQQVLADQTTSVETFWDKSEIKRKEQQRFLCDQMREYKDLKKILLQIFLNTQPGDSKREVLMDFRPYEVLRRITVQDKFAGSYMGQYSRLTQNCLAVEVMRACGKRKLSEAERSNDKGDKFNSEGKYLEALPYLDRAIQLSPRFCLPLVNKGISLRNLGRLDEAITCCYDKVLNDIIDNVACGCSAFCFLYLYQRETS